jgi:hypothetical protein
MAQENLISFKLTAEEEAKVEEAIGTLHSILLPKLKTLTPEERHEMAKMGDKTIAFVQKSFDYCKQNPDLVPPFIDVKEFEIDLNAVSTLNKFYKTISPLSDSIYDSIMLSGSEVYAPALMFYSVMKNAKANKVQKASSIYDDLSVRFPGRPKKST